jgi:hypothetical protein
VDSRAEILLSNLNRYGAAALSVVTITALMVYPIPFCIDCEYPNPWGHVNVKGEVFVSFWLLIAPLLAGAFPIKKGWMVPIVAVLALVATQPLGGVAWWSLRDNEGPLILLLGVPLAGLTFGVGRLTRTIVTSVPCQFRLTRSVRHVLRRRFQSVPGRDHFGDKSKLMMLRKKRPLNRWARVVVVICTVAAGYHWLGIASFAIGLVVFMLYELLMPPPRYRTFGPGQIQEAIDNRFGHFGKAYREDEPPQMAGRKVTRNDPCPCGSGLKFKRCCGLTQEP